MTKRKKILLWIGIPLLAFIVAASVLAGLYFGNDPSRDIVKNYDESLAADAILSRAEAEEDLAYVYGKIGEKHYSAIGGVPENVTAAYEAAVAGLSDANPVYEVLRLAKSIVSPLRDGHATFGFVSKPGETVKFSAEIKVDNHGKAYVYDRERAKDFEIKKINGVAVETLLANARAIESYENEYWLYARFERALSSPELLAAYGAGYDESKLVLTVVDESGVESERISEPLDTEGDNFTSEESVSYRIDEEAGLGTLEIRKCVYDDSYKTALKAFFTEVKEKKLASVAVDLRRNGGGNSLCGDELLRYLDVTGYRSFSSKIRWGIFDLSVPSKTVKNQIYSDLAFSGNFYVITSRETFSSATMIATLVYDNGLGKIVGEPTGNAPTAYGNVLLYQLPNSKLLFQVTYMRFTRPDAENAENTIPPDYPTDDADALLRKLAIQNKNASSAGGEPDLRSIA